MQKSFVWTALFGLLVLAGCGAKLTAKVQNGPVDDKATCKSINSEGTAVFLRIKPSPTLRGHALVTFKWIGKDGTVYDTNEYTMDTDARCISDEKLSVGSTPVVEAWVKCPQAAQSISTMSVDAVVPYAFIFPNMKSEFCQWTDVLPY